MSDYKIPGDEKLQAAKQKFSELSQIDELLSSSEKLSSVSPSALFAYANGAENETVEKALGENLALRRIYRDMLEKNAVYYVPEAMAASSAKKSDDILSREGKGCRIRMEPSRAEPNQVYVIVELSGNEKVTPTTLVVCDVEANCSRFPLPKIRDGVAQIIADRDADLVRLLSDPKTEAFIR
tara:strand:- start:6290 stop:6835 length:546 start_codon:yes stop_codon:yes gene_type:complete